MDSKVGCSNPSNHRIIFTLSFLLFTSIILICSNSGLAQSTDIYITIDQDFQKADFTVDDAQTIKVTGNITIDTDSAAVTVYFGTYVPEGWTTTISPEEVTATFGPTTISFESTITPQGQVTQEEYNIYVWASVEEKNPSEIDIISSTSNVFSDSSIIEVIKNRVQMISDAKDGLFSHIGLYRADRFGRNTVEGLQAAKLLIGLGIKIRIASMPTLHPENPDGFFMLLIQMGTIKLRKRFNLGWDTGIKTKR